jgi:hypothetical protein
VGYFWDEKQEMRSASARSGGNPFVACSSAWIKNELLGKEQDIKIDRMLDHQKKAV